MRGVLSSTHGLIDVLPILKDRPGRLVVEGPHTRSFVAYSDGHMLHCEDIAPDVLAARVADRLRAWGALSWSGYSVALGHGAGPSMGGTGARGERSANV